jgi:ribosomal protein L31
MSHITASLFVDIHLANAKVTVCCDGNCFLIESTVGVCSILQMVLMVLAAS